MTVAYANRSRTFLLVLGALFCGLLLSLSVMPTVLACKSGATSVVSPPPAEEEQHGSREGGKVNEATFGHEWCCSVLLFGKLQRAAMRDLGESLPDKPLAAVPERPPRLS